MYYLFSGEGGTERGHMETVARSISPWGPFEPAPHNPVLTHRHLTLHPVHCTGHADLVEARDGSTCGGFRGVGVGPERCEEVRIRA
jgi:xylan 1,4-beta-xylosidase